MNWEKNWEEDKRKALSSALEILSQRKAKVAINTKSTVINNMTFNVQINNILGVNES